MASLYRVVLAWSGAPVVGSAVTVLHFDGSNQSAPPVAGILTAMQNLIPALANNVTVTLPGSGDKIDDRTGALTGVWAGSGAGSITGAGGSASAAGVGACIGWTTGGIVNGSKGPRKLRGRTFIVPLHNACYEANGTLVQGTINNLTAFASGLMAAGPLAIWHRPTTPGGVDGNSYAVLSSKVRDKVAYLSSRRD
jgi:hypothetical protein